MSYKDVRIRSLEIEVDDWVQLKVSPIKVVMSFGNKGNLSIQYVNPYRISQRIGKVAYLLEIPQELAAVFPIFHISMLKNYMGGPSLIIKTEDIRINNNSSDEEIHVQVLDCKIYQLRSEEVLPVKVLWTNQLVEEAT